MKRINSRGSHTIEYAIVLACIVSVATTFFSGDTLKNILDKTMGGIVTMLGGNTSSNILANKGHGLAGTALIGKEEGDSLKAAGNRVAIVSKNDESGDGLLFALEGNQDYEVVVDIAALENAGLTPADFKVCLLVWEGSDPHAIASLDTSDMGLTLKNATHTNKSTQPGSYADSTVKSLLSADGKTMTYSFSTQENAYFGMNLVYYGGGGQNKDYLNQISQNYQNYVTLQKATK